jgi:uncharacterized protein (DUF433 family)
VQLPEAVDPPRGDVAEVDRRRAQPALCSPGTDVVGTDMMVSMPIDAEELLKRVTQKPGFCGGRPCIRGLRIRVADVLEMLAEGVREDEILADFPDLQRDDIRACLVFAAKRAAHVEVAA